MQEISVKEYEKIKREIALEIIELFKSRNLPVALIDDVIEYTGKIIHKSAYL